MIKKIILLTVLVVSLSSCVTISENERTKNFSGDVYQFNIDASFQTDITGVGKKQASISYPSIPCKGVLELLEEGEMMSLYKETITEGVDRCTQGGYVKIERMGDKHYFYYFWPTKDDFYAQGELLEK